MAHLILSQVGTPNPAQINPRSGTRFGGGLDPSMGSTDPSIGMSIVSEELKQN